MKYLLDTDHVSLFQKNERSIHQKISQIDIDQVLVSIITAEEQMRGWLNVIRRHYHDEKVRWAYQGFMDALKFYNSVPILPFDHRAFDQYQALKKQQLRIGSQDIRIAAIALANRCIVVTRNDRDFSQVPNLLTENWTA